MSIYQRIPCAPLNKYISWLWYYSDFHPDHEREHVLPDGTFELVINLEDRPRKLFDRDNLNRHQSFRRGWMSGTHKGYLVIDALQDSSMIGAHFKPGGAGPFLGVPSGELGEQVVELDALWGNDAWDWRDRLLAATGSKAKFAVLEQLLLSCLAKERPGGEGRKKVNWAIAKLLGEPQVPCIGRIASELGLSHKHFISEFRREVGLTPKLFCRVRRFQQVLAQIHSRACVSWTDVAYNCGYFDQAHFINDFRLFAGVNPSTYLREQLDGAPNFIRADV